MGIKDMVIGAVLIYILGSSIIKGVMYPEQVSSTQRYHLMNELNRGDEQAIEYYRDRYIARDVYLFDGDLSFSLFVEKYGIINVDSVYRQYKASGKSLDDFVMDWKVFNK